MMDPRLNSIHLPAPRREQFRQARNALLASCGEQTLCPEAPANSVSSHTLIGHDAARAQSDLICWLADRDYVYPLQVGLNTVGRSPENDVVVEDAYVSRRHCAVLVHHDCRCELHDVASKNGTFLNGVRIARPTRLKPGDAITMSDRQLVFMTRSGGALRPEVHPTLGD
jgi:hypothetical protein